ncbi:molybdopterin-dependent oxidoreductase [Chloroflexota bacterium]
MEKIIKTVCNMCFANCGINVHVEKGKIVKVTTREKHPSHTLCVKAEAIPELLNSKERLTNPLKKVGEKFREISWEEAFDFISERLSEIKRKYGPQAVLVHLGNPFVFSPVEKVVRRFCDLYGTPNFTAGASFCWVARNIGDSLTCGSRVLPSFSPDTRCMLLWGINTTESQQCLRTHEIHALTESRAKLVVVDPRRTALAKEADIHAQLRPGTDCALAIGLLNVIIAERLYDQAFVEDWTVGFDKLAEHVKEYMPEQVERITWVKADIIREMARIYAAGKPACISRGISMDHSTNGIQAIRAINTLMAITGNIDVAGGNVFTPKFTQTNLRLEEMVPKSVSVGADYPLFTRYVREPTVTPAIDQLLSEKPYPIKALLVAGTNPALTWPNSNKFKRGREKLDLLLAIDIFMTDTAKMADIVLPGTSFLERLDLKDYMKRSICLIALADRVAEPVGNSMEDWRIWAELGKRMGFGKYFPWKDSDELITYLLKDTSVSMEQLRQSPAHLAYYARKGYQSYLKDGFNTPSKKVEIYSKMLEDSGYGSLPVFREPAESPISRPDLVDKYPLTFVSGLRTVAYYHSQYRNLPTMRKLVPEPLLEINPKTARSLNIAPGDLVTVESVRGSIRIKVKLTEDVHPEMVTMQHGWSEANANCLTDDEKRDPISGYPGFRSVMCRVTKA